MVAKTTTTPKTPRCACPVDECRHGSRWAEPDASQARIKFRNASDRPSGGYREPTARERALAAASSLAPPRARFDTATVSRMLRTIGACAVADVSAADRLALATGEREDGSPIVGRAAAALIRRVGCPECPVRDACARWAVAMGQEEGFYGGMGVRARREYVAATAPTPVPPPAPTAERDTRSLADRLAAEAERRAAHDALARAAFAMRYRPRAR